jgi:hypothetical protein
LTRQQAVKLVILHVSVRNLVNKVVAAAIIPDPVVPTLAVRVALPTLVSATTAVERVTWPSKELINTTLQITYNHLGIALLEVVLVAVAMVAQVAMVATRVAMVAAMAEVVAMAEVLVAVVANPAT